MTENTDEPMSRTERMDIIRVAKLTAKQAERELETQEAVIRSEIEDQLTAEFERHDALWAEAIILAEEATAKANAHIREQCAALGIPPKEAPQLHGVWSSRGPSYSDRCRRAELRKLAETRAAALTKMGKTTIQRWLVDEEKRLLEGGLTSREAQQTIASIPTVEKLMPAITLDDLGVKRWVPDEDAAARLLTPFTPADRQRRMVLRAIEAHPDATDVELAAITGVDVRKVAAYTAEYDRASDADLELEQLRSAAARFLDKHVE